jgi:hypothetical protein
MTVDGEPDMVGLITRLPVPGEIGGYRHMQPDRQCLRRLVLRLFAYPVDPRALVVVYATVISHTDEQAGDGGVATHFVNPFLFATSLAVALRFPDLQ